MNIHNVEFAGAIGQPGQAAPATIGDLPQIAISGRSNVGKSSLINRFLGRTRSPIARVSQTPGKTQEINFYHVHSDVCEFVLVDLPGYGYAQAPDAVREKWGEVIRQFLENEKRLLGMVQLLDVRRDPTGEDLTALDQLAQLGLPTLVVLTKADKFKTQKRRAAIKRIREQLGVEEEQLLTTSSLSGMGVEELRDALEALLRNTGATEAEEISGEA